MRRLFRRHDRGRGWNQIEGFQVDKMTPKQQIIDVIKQRIESLTRAIEIISEYDDLKLTEHGMESVKEELETLLIWVQESM